MSEHKYSETAVNIMACVISVFYSAWFLMGSVLWKFEQRENYGHSCFMLTLKIAIYHKKLE